MNAWLNIEDPIASIGLLLYFILIFIFGYYTQLVNMNPIEMAAELKRSGAVIIGVVPGADTEQYLKQHIGRLNRLGCLGLCFVAFIPIFLGRFFGVTSLSFLGTSLIIIVAVFTETWYTWRVEKRSLKYLKYRREMELFGKKKRVDPFVMFTKLR
mgnify:CR=1 FL=1